jgi:hypothetical protein
MPQDTRVYRCVHRLKKKYRLSGAIAICQKATKQSYMTGRTLRKKKRARRRPPTRRRRSRRRGGNPWKWWNTYKRRQRGRKRRGILRKQKTARAKAATRRVSRQSSYSSKSSSVPRSPDSRLLQSLSTNTSLTATVPSSLSVASTRTEYLPPTSVGSIVSTSSRKRVKKGTKRSRR